MMTVGTSLKQLFQLCSGKYLKSEPSKFKAVNKVCLCWLCQADLTEKRGGGGRGDPEHPGVGEQGGPGNQPRPPCSVVSGGEGAPWLRAVPASSQAAEGEGPWPSSLSSYAAPVSRCAPTLSWARGEPWVSSHTKKEKAAPCSLQEELPLPARVFGTTAGGGQLSFCSHTATIRTSTCRCRCDNLSAHLIFFS